MNNFHVVFFARSDILSKTDPYLYDDVPVLRNKLNIKDNSRLEETENLLTKIKLLTVDDVKGNFDYQHLMNIHEHIFGDIYDWAGTSRQVNTEKEEHVLGGLSVVYSSRENIEKDAIIAIDTLHKVEWRNLSLKEKSESFAAGIASLWKVHPFREGNTRTIMTFGIQFAAAKGFMIDHKIFAEHSSYTRNALVLASIGEYSEAQHLNRIVLDAMKIGQSMEQNKVGIKEKIKAIQQQEYKSPKKTNPNKKMDLDR